MDHKTQKKMIIYRKISYILQRYIEDPRLQSITITAIKLSGKLDYADIKITQLNTHFSTEDTLKSLQKAAARIRYYLGKELARARRMPKLRFHYDTAAQKNVQLHQLINQTTDHD